jgi:hypothetical protein
MFEIKVGDIFVQTWGYDQTNADFFQVIKVNASSIVVRHIKSKETTSPNDNMYGTVVPLRGQFDEAPMLKKPYEFMGRPSFRVNSYSSAQPWDGKPQSVSHTG